MSCPHTSEEAKRLWYKACNFHRRSDISHRCGNPSACKRTMREAEAKEKAWTSFQREMC